VFLLLEFSVAPVHVCVCVRQAYPAIRDVHPDSLLYLHGKPHPTGEGTLDYYKYAHTLLSTTAESQSLLY